MRLKRSGMTLVEFLVVVAIIGGLIFLLLPSVRLSREAARRNSCLNNLGQIALALLNYHDEHGAFPPAYTVDENGNRLHSWRTLILPHMGYQRIYDLIDLTKPWDDPANSKARETVVGAYICPSYAGDEETIANYLAVVVPGSIFSDSPRSLSDVSDGPSRTMAVIEVGQDHVVHWMSPFDAGEEVFKDFANWKTNHPGISQAVFLDGHVSAIRMDVDQEVLRGMLTIAGGEEIDF